MYTFCDEKVHGSTTPSLQVSPDIGAESCSSIALIGNPSYCWMLAAHTWGPNSSQVAYGARFGWCMCQRA